MELIKSFVPHSRCFGSYFDVIFLMYLVSSGFSFKPTSSCSSSSSSTQFSQEWARRKVVVKHSIKSKSWYVGGGGKQSGYISIYIWIYWRTKLRPAFCTRHSLLAKLVRWGGGWLERKAFKTLDTSKRLHQNESRGIGIVSKGLDSQLLPLSGTADSGMGRVSRYSETGLQGTPQYHGQTKCP